MAFANITPAENADGLVYADATPLTAQEADLYNKTVRANVDPATVVYGQSILAIVVFAVTGSISSNTSYVVMQTDLGGGNWVDIAWCLFTGTTGTQVNALSNGIAGANSFRQSRASGSAPASDGSNQCQLGGRIRFVGKSTIGGSSSSSSSGSVINGVNVTIRFKMCGLR